MTMIEVKTAELIGPPLEFMVHMADVNPSYGRVIKTTSNFYVHFDRVEFVRDYEQHTLVSVGVPVPISMQRGYIAAKLGDVVSVPAELVQL